MVGCHSRYKGASGSSAVCAFTMDQVERAFNGRYREVNRETQQWYTYNHPIPEPRPGVVSTCCPLLDTPLHCRLKAHVLVVGLYAQQPCSNRPLRSISPAPPNLARASVLEQISVSLQSLSAPFPEDLIVSGSSAAFISWQPYRSPINGGPQTRSLLMRLAGRRKRGREGGSCRGACLCVCLCL